MTTRCDRRTSFGIAKAREIRSPDVAFHPGANRVNPGSLLLPHRSDGGRDGESEKRGGKLRAKGLRMRGAENTETPLWRMGEGEGGGGRVAIPRERHMT